MSLALAGSFVAPKDPTADQQSSQMGFLQELDTDKEDTIVVTIVYRPAFDKCRPTPQRPLRLGEVSAATAK